ncbi:MAG: tripartite tricarboxylate transporter substrate binding protein [Burkholderiales bacterium]|nr:tripartite tricarboxylate transporter substrate binding protein [Burkholderiales bacterium]
MKTLPASVVCAALSTPAAGALAQPAFPTKPIRLVIGFAPGGGTDVLARALGQQLGETFGQAVTIDNRVGAGGIIATDLVAKAPADGYTLLVGSAAAFAINPNLMAKLPYHPVKDFAPVGLFATISYAIVVHPSLPVRSVKELITLAKSKPGQLNYGSAGNGSSTHLAIEQLLAQAGIKMTHVPYKGNTPAMTALLSGEVTMVFDPVLTSLPQVKAGRIRAIAVSTAKRSALLPDVPSVAEAGVPGYESGNWFGIFAPAGTPRAVVDRLNGAINKAMASGEMRSRLQSQGADPLLGTPEDLARHVERELAKVAKIVRDAGLKIE